MGLLTALVVLVGALIPVYRELRRNTRVTVGVAKATVGIAEAVNGRYTELQAYQRVLIAALREAGVTVPLDVSIEDRPKE